MTSFKPTENSQVFKRLYTKKSTFVSQLKKKTLLCRDYCNRLNVSLEKADTGQKEYKEFNFEKRINIQPNRAQIVIDIYTDHINEVEAETGEPLFSKEEIQSTPGLIRLRAEPQDALYHKNLGKIILLFDEFYRGNDVSRSRPSTTTPSPTLQQSLTPTWLQYLNSTAVRVSVIVVIILLMGPFIKININKGYSAEQHKEMLQTREAELWTKILTQYKETSSRHNTKLIDTLENKLYNTRQALTIDNIFKQSYAKQIVFLEKRNHYLDRIKHQVVNKIFDDASEALRIGDTSKAYQLYEDYKQKSEATIQQVALANYEQGIINEDQLHYREAFSHYQRAVQLHPGNNRYNNKSGRLALVLGHYNEALGYYEKTLDKNLESYDNNHPDIANNWNNIGIIWMELAQFDKAISYFENALDSDLKTYGPDHQNVARDWNNLGDIWRAKGQYDKAIDYYEKSLASNLQTYGNDHPKVAIQWSNLGRAWNYKGQQDKAINYYEKALSSHLKSYGENHPHIAIVWNNLGEAWHTKGQLDKAIAYYEKALASDLKTYGEDHHNVAIRWNNLGSVWYMQKQYDKAINYYEKALTSNLKTYGNDHPKVAIRWNNLGESWRAKGQYDKAITYFQKALASDLKTYGNDHPDVAIDWSNIGKIWYAKGLYNKAIEYHEKALLIFKTKLGEDHRYTKKCLKNIELAKNAAKNSS